MIMREPHARLVAAALLAAPAVAAESSRQGPIPGTAPGNPASPVLEETYPFFSTWLDLAASGYVEEEFYVSGAGRRLRDRRRQARVRRAVPDAGDRPPPGLGGRVQRHGARRVAERHGRLRPRRALEPPPRARGLCVGRRLRAARRRQPAARLEPDSVRGARRHRRGAFLTDQLSYDIFAQAAEARAPVPSTCSGASTSSGCSRIGASQSAGRMTVYYNVVLPQEQPVFDGFAFIVGSAPTRVGTGADHPGALGDGRDDAAQRAAPTATSSAAGRSPAPRTRAGRARSTGVRFDPRPRRRAGLRVHESAVQPGSAEPGDRGGVRAPRPLGRRRGAAAARPVPRVHDSDDQGAQRARPRARRHPALAGRGADRPQHRLELGPVVLHPLRHASPFDDEQLAALYRNHGRYVGAVARTDAANVEAGISCSRRTRRRTSARPRTRASEVTGEPSGRSRAAPSAARPSRTRFGEPLREGPDEGARALDLELAGADRARDRGVAEPDPDQGAEPAGDHQVDLEAGVAVADVDLVAVEDQPGDAWEVAATSVNRKRTTTR